MDATSYSDSIVGTKMTTLVTTTLSEVAKLGGMNGTSGEQLVNGHRESSMHEEERLSSPQQEKASNGISKTHHPTTNGQRVSVTTPVIIPTRDEPRPSLESLTHVNVSRSAFKFGPDQVIASQDVYTVVPNGRVKIDMDESGLGAVKPISVPGMLHKTATSFPDVTAMATKNSNGTWDTITYREYEMLVRTCAKAFIKLGLERYHSVCIMGFNTPEWFISDFAAIYAGGFAAGIYTTNSPEACLYCAESSRANILVVQDQHQVDKIMVIKDRLPELRAIVQYEGKPTTEGVLSWDELMKLGEEQPDTELEKVMQTIAVNECCTLVYTSGTVGNPKAVMLSHDNLTWTAKSAGNYLDLEKGNGRAISFLPLSHAAAQLVDLFVCCTFAITVYFADANALKGSLGATLQEVQPSTILAVPRVWEKIEEKMVQVGSQSTGIKKSIVMWAKEVGMQHSLNRMNKKDDGYALQYKVANALVFSKVKRTLGLDRCLYLISGAAPISPETLKFFWSLDLLILEGFGMSESSGGHTLNRNDAFRLESIGKSIPGCLTKILNPDENNQGEIMMKGRNIFMGYLNELEKTKEALEDDGWLHSGDVGNMDKDGFFYITGRIKEVLITAGGENIPPVQIEYTIREELPCISNVVVIGDKRKFLTVLLTMKTNVNVDTGEPLDELTATAKAWCQGVGSSASTVSELIAGPDEKVWTAIQKGIERSNKKAISNAQKVQKFAILPKDLSMFTGELGPTMKLKRKEVYSKYADVIENFYKE